MKKGVLLLSFFMASMCPVYAQSLASKIEYQGPSQYVHVTDLRSRINNGFLAIQAELENKDSTPRSVFWRVKWLDESGFQVSVDEVWKPLVVHRQGRQNIFAMAPAPDARDFRIQISAKETGGNQRDGVVEPTNPYGI